MAQIINITSEALQATIRRLLPSQQGFGEDLQATNVITPIIDVTPTAEGSQLPLDLSSAYSFASNTAFAASNSTVVLANTPGFWSIRGCVTAKAATGTFENATLQLTDGLGTKNVWRLEMVTSATDQFVTENVDFTVFLDTGDSVSAISSSANVEFNGSYRQIADRYGNIVNPSGFTFE